MAGLKLKRLDNYLQNAQKSGTGKLELALERTSLIQRTLSAGDSAAEKRSRLHPKSNALSNAGARAVVAGLEREFDAYDKEHTAAREFGSGALKGDDFGNARDI